MSAGCPSSVCCQLSGGCDYVEDAHSLCASNRDSDSLLCSRCIEGYSESMNSVNCTKCKENVHWIYLLLPLGLSLLILIILLFTNREAKSESDTNEVANASSDNVVDSMEMSPPKTKTSRIELPSLAKITIYFEQGMSQILSTMSTASWSTALSGAFDISTHQIADGISSDKYDWCFIDGLNAKWKIIMDLVAPLMICVFMAVLFVLSKCIIRKGIMLRGRAVNFEAVGLGLFLFIIGKVMDTLFKVMSCQPVGTQSVHFYFGFEECYGATWFLSLFILLLIAVLFGAVFVFARKLTEQERADRNRFINKVSKRFLPQYWYWEYVIFLRRLIIAYFAVSATDLHWQLVFIVVVSIFVAIQWKLAPFVSAATNQAEYILLCALPIIIAAKMLSVTTSYMFPADFLSVTVLLPIPVMTFFVVRVVTKEHQRAKSEVETEREQCRSSKADIEMQGTLVQSDSAMDSDFVTPSEVTNRTGPPVARISPEKVIGTHRANLVSIDDASELQEIGSIGSDIMDGSDMDDFDGELTQGVANDANTEGTGKTKRRSV